MSLNEFFSKYWRLLWLGIFLFSSRQGFGQMAVEVEKVNVVFLGLENPITVVINDVPSTCVLLEPSNGRIKKREINSDETEETAQYIWTFINTDTNVISLKVIDSCTHDLIAERSYRVFEMPVDMRLGAQFKAKPFPLALLKRQEAWLRWLTAATSTQNLI